MGSTIVKIDGLAIAGLVGRLVEAGADSVVLVPLPEKDLNEPERLAGWLLPLLA